MPRWLQIVLSLVLFAVAMLLVRTALHATVPTAIDWLDSQIGSKGTWILLIGGLIGAAAYGFWPRFPDGTAKPLLPRRR